METKNLPSKVRPFIKMHGLRNHFVIIDARTTPFRPSKAEIVRICDQQIGVGAEQLVVLEPAQAPDAQVFMRLYNVTGQEVGACGNATRCAAWLILEEQSRDTVNVETLAGVLSCRRAGDDLITCDMGPVRTGWAAIPLSRNTEQGHIDLAGLEGGSAVNVGNPHVVFFVDDIAAVDLAAVAPQIQAAALFPESVNVGLAQMSSDKELCLRVFERGAGLTMACGTGACAAAYVAETRGFLRGGQCTVRLPGGVVRIHLDQRETGIHAIMTGPVAYSFRGEIETS